MPEPEEEDGNLRIKQKPGFPGLFLFCSSCLSEARCLEVNLVADIRHLFPVNVILDYDYSRSLLELPELRQCLFQTDVALLGAEVLAFMIGSIRSYKLLELISCDCCSEAECLIVNLCYNGPPSPFSGNKRTRSGDRQACWHALISFETGVYS